MLPSVAADANLVKSFIREARLASHLRHANVAQTYDLGKVGETYFIAMELVPGRNLREVLKHCAASGVHMPLPIAMNIVNQISDALDYAHNLCDETGAAARHHPSRCLAVERDRQRRRHRQADRLRHREGVRRAACRR